MSHPDRDGIPGFTGRQKTSGIASPGDPALCHAAHAVIFRKGPLFYGEYNFRLLLVLLFRRYDLLLSNDLDTLPANRMAGRIRCKPVVYDSHEYFTEVPELVNRPRIQAFWCLLEKWLVPGITAGYTVSQPIADIYTRLYGIPFAVVRNLPNVWKEGTEEEEEDDFFPGRKALR